MTLSRTSSGKCVVGLCRGVLCAALAVITAGGACAETGVWTATSKTTLDQYDSWTTSGNWKNGYVPGGPGREDDTADLSAYSGGNDATYFHTILLPVAANAAVNFTNATIVSDARVRLRTLINSSNKGDRTYTFSDLSGFPGFLELMFPATLNFRASTSIAHLCSSYQPTLSVPDPDLSLDVNRIYGWGKIRKTGPGALKISSFAGEETRLEIAGGGVELSGETSGLDTTRPGGTPMMWFDASATNRMELVEDTDGNLRVQRWYDVRTSGYTTTAGQKGSEALPVLRKREEDGKWIADFGDLLSSGDSNARALKFSYDPGRVFRAVYFVFKSNGSYAPPLLGDENAKDFMQDVGESATYRGPYLTTTDGYYGITKFGDLSIDGNRMFYNGHYQIPGFHILAFVPYDGGIRGQGLCFNRATKHGGAQIAEVILYNAAVTEDQHRQTIAYLKNKWLKGLPEDRSANWDVGETVLAADGTVSVPSGKTARMKSVSSMAGESFSKTGAGTLEVDLVAAAPRGTCFDNGKRTIWNTSVPPPVSVNGGTLRVLKTTANVSSLTKEDLPAGAAIHLDPTDTSSFTFSNGDEISQWRDCRPTGVGCAWTETVSADSPTTKPRLVTGGINGLDCVSMEKWDKNNLSGTQWMWLDTASQAASSSPSANNGLVSFFVVMSQTRAGDGWGNFVPLGNSSSRNLYAVTGGLSGGVFDAGAPTEFSSVVPGGYYALDGCPMYQPGYKMITNVVVFSANILGGAKINTLARSQSAFSGGFRFGEVIGYNRLLTPAEVRRVEGYLLKRWKGIDHPYDAPRHFGATTVAAGAKLAVGKGATVAVDGALALENGAALGLEGVGETPQLAVSGTMTLGAGMTLAIDFAGDMPDENTKTTYTLASADSFSGDPAAVTLALPDGFPSSKKMSARLRVDGKSLKLRCAPVTSLMLLVM